MPSFGLVEFMMGLANSKAGSKGDSEWSGSVWKSVHCVDGNLRKRGPIANMCQSRTGTARSGYSWVPGFHKSLSTYFVHII